NFSVMAAVLRRAATMAAEHIGAWEIIDYASDTKPDVPSGTARDLAETLGQVREPARAVPLADLEGPAEARGAEVGGTRVHSVRLPGFVVSSEVVFAGPGERLVMRHDPGLTPARTSRAPCWPCAAWPTPSASAAGSTRSCSRIKAA
ncbi:MAG TPA: dihydrodipicolinate reductase C-terminal domain-containing protein, partial [Streptosporangiaceae bacterium]